MFIEIHRHLVENISFSHQQRSRYIIIIRTLELAKAALEEIGNDPQTSTREIARDLQLGHTI